MNRLRRTLLRHLPLFVLAASAPAGARAAELSLPSAEEVLGAMAEQLQQIAGNPARSAIYSNLAYLQLQYRVVTDFSGYESSEDFRKGAFEAVRFALFDDKSYAMVAAQGLDVRAFQQARPDMVSAFEREREGYLTFLERLNSEVETGEGAALSPQLLMRSMAFYALQLLALDVNRFQMASQGSWIWPFCTRRTP